MAQINIIKNINRKYIYIFICSLTLTPANAFADAGIPMILVTMPAMLIGLIPIIMIEAYILKKDLNLNYKKSLTSSAVANTTSTLIGIPLTWITLVTIQMLTGGGNSYGLQTFFQKFLAVTWQAPWLVPYESDLKWMIPIAMIILLLPFFIVSWKIEHLIIKKLNKQIDDQIIKSASLKANLATYILLALCALIMLILNF